VHVRTQNTLYTEGKCVHVRTQNTLRTEGKTYNIYFVRNFL